MNHKAGAGQRFSSDLYPKFSHPLFFLKFDNLKFLFYF